MSDLFLNISNSLTGRRWVDRLDSPPKKNLSGAISERYDLDQIISRIMAGRGVTLEESQNFLEPTLRDLMPNPNTLTDMSVTVNRLADAITKRERVGIIGDYDVDGACSSALLSRVLGYFDIECDIYIPDRILDGYGPNISVVTNLLDRGADLLITVDCGSTGYDSFGVATERGIDVLVMDHHQVGDGVVPVLGFVNPNRDDDLSGLGYLCATGVVFLVLVGLLSELRSRGRTDLPDLIKNLDVVSLATVCDVVPLRGLNRAFVKRGLDIFRSRENIGLVSLCRASRLDGPVTPYHLGYVLGPRINAGGRIGDSGLGARLLTCDDSDETDSIADKLSLLNEERRTMERSMLIEAVDEASSEIGSGVGPPVLVTASDSWHAGVVGLLATRLRERYHRPCFAISFDKNGVGTGSGRSVSGVDLGSLVRRAVESGLLSKGGGHAMAAGITLNRDQLGAFRLFLEDNLSHYEVSRGDLHIDGALSASGATEELLTNIERAGPYGSGHPTPIFVFPNHTLSYSKYVGSDQNHVSFTLTSGDNSTLRGILFGADEKGLGEPLTRLRGSRAHFVGTLSRNFYRGRTSVQLGLIDIAVSE